MQAHSNSRPLLRQQLIGRRLALSAAERQRADERLCASVGAIVRAKGARQVACYWPIRGEPDLRPAWTDWPGVALPVVVESEAALRFAPWTATTRLAVGAYGIPVPDGAGWVDPDLIIVPCVGFFRGPDGRTYRLGYGAGLYDRTLARLRVETLGVCYALGQIDGLAPQAHDVPLDALVTELGSS